MDHLQWDVADWPFYGPIQERLIGDDSMGGAI